MFIYDELHNLDLRAAKLQFQELEIVLELIIDTDTIHLMFPVTKIA